MDADANAKVNAEANINTKANANADVGGGSTIALHERCSGELKRWLPDITFDWRHIMKMDVTT